MAEVSVEISAEATVEVSAVDMEMISAEDTTEDLAVVLAAEMEEALVATEVVTTITADPAMGSRAEIVMHRLYLAVMAVDSVVEAMAVVSEEAAEVIRLML